MLAAAAVLLSAPAAHASTPARAAAAFYEWSIRSGASGAPDPAQQEAMRPLVTAELHCLLAGAWKVMDAYRRKYPGDKPPFVEGDLYSSVSEGPSAARVVRITQAGATKAVAAVRLRYQDRHNNLQWSDRVHLRRELGHWKVADLERRYEGSKENASLLKSLHAELPLLDPDGAILGATICKTQP